MRCCRPFPRCPLAALLLIGTGWPAASLMVAIDDRIPRVRPANKPMSLTEVGAFDLARGRHTIALTRLQELVTELYLADTDAKKKRLWQQVEKALNKLKIKNH